MADYNQKLASYNQQMTSLTTDQHKIVNSSHVWPYAYTDKSGLHGDWSRPYAKVNYHIDVTWHWDSSINNVVVTNVEITLGRDAPISTANGFWDAMVLINPNNTISQQGGTFKDGEPDLPGINGDIIWNNIGNKPGVQAFFAQNNGTHAFTIRYNHNNSVPYNGVNRGNGTYDVLDAYIRSNTGTAGTKAVKWDSISNLVTIQLPVPPVHPSVPAKPTPQTTTVRYHHDVTHAKK